MIPEEVALASYRRAMNWADGQPPRGTGDNWALQLRDLGFNERARRPPAAP
jgi:hypothetical protein